MPTIQESREVVLQHYGDLALEQNADRTGPERLYVDADAALMPKLSGRVRGNRLVLGLTMPWYEWAVFWFTWIFLPDKGIRYRLTLNRIEGLAISGAGSVSADRLRADGLRMKVSGSGVVRYLGQPAISQQVSGSGRIRQVR